MLVLLIAWEIVFAPKGERGRVALRLIGAFTAIVVIGVAVLWAFYGFRYCGPASRSGQMNPTLASFVCGTAPVLSMLAAVMAFAHMHLLPESYLVGLVDVKRMAEFYPTFSFSVSRLRTGFGGTSCLCSLIKTTLGMLGLIVALAFCRDRDANGMREGGSWRSS